MLSQPVRGAWTATPGRAFIVWADGQGRQAAGCRRLSSDDGDIASCGPISLHSLSHSFATELLGPGVPLLDGQEAIGHADPGV